MKTTTGVQAAKPPRSGRKSVTFRFKAGPERNVRLAGTFNGWKPDKHGLRYVPSEGGHRLTLLLPPGTYEYKFIVDGAWHLDPLCSATVPNRFGGLNNVVAVGSA